MGELLEAIFQAVNLPFTLLLALVVLYWLSVILGFLDVDTFDIDALDVDVDFDTDVDVDADADIGALGAVAQFFGIGHVPIAIPFSVLFLSLWAGSVLLNDFFNPDMTWPRAGLLFIPNLLIALIVTGGQHQDDRQYLHHRFPARRRRTRPGRSRHQRRTTTLNRSP